MPKRISYSRMIKHTSTVYDGWAMQSYENFDVHKVMVDMMNEMMMIMVDMMNAMLIMMKIVMIVT